MANATSQTLAILRRYRATVDRYLSLLAKENGMHHTDASALSHLVDQAQRDTVLTAGELGDLLSLSGPATTAAIDRLQDKGLVVRKHSATDGRRVEIHLTDAVDVVPGTSMFAELGGAVRTLGKRHTAAELQTFMTMLEELTEDIDEANRRRQASLPR